MKELTGKKNEREIRFELLRICSMLLIVTSHLITYGQVLDHLDATAANYWIAWIIRGFCRVSVPAFILIDGYFMCEKEFKLQKLVLLWGSVMFYETILSAVMIWIQGQQFPKMQVIYDLAPIMSGRYWFITQYAMLMVVSPVLNRAIKSMSQREHLSLIVCLVLVFSLFANMFAGIYDFSKVGSGSNFIWFVVLYFTAAYIKKWPLKYHSCCFWGVGYVIFALCNALVTRMIVLFQFPVLCNQPLAFYEMNSIFTYLASICFFLFFAQGLQGMEHRFKLRNQILSLGKMTLAIYLISDNAAVRDFLWVRLLHVPEFVNSLILWPYAVVCVVVIFTACCCVEKIRALLFDKLHITGALQWISRCINAGYQKCLDWFLLRI